LEQKANKALAVRRGIGERSRQGKQGASAVVEVRRNGIRDPKAVFNELRPYRERLIALMGQCRPFQADFLVLHAAQKAIDAAAHYFTGDPWFYGLAPEQSKHSEPPG
jgi:hypothetical protein